jgi:GR25 family glycosyltransferase involved in LPS biosynthesis
MKIAYIFFGQVKNFNEKQFNSFNENVYRYIDSHDVDFHLVTSKNLKYSNPRQQESEDEENNIYYQSIKKYFNFKNTFYDELDSIDCSEIKNLSEKLINQFGGAWGEDSKISTENSLKQIYSLEFFYNQFSKLDKNYDLYIFSRSDLFHTHPIDISQFSNDYDILVPYYDNLPQIDYGWFGGVNDRFAVIKNKEAMKGYCCRYSRLKKSPEFYHAEKYLMKCIREDNLKIGKIHNFELRFVRGNGKITDQIGIYPDKSMNVKLKNISKSYFINLDRRVDRLNHMLINLPFFAERFSAIDCNTIELNDEVKMLFPKTWKERTKAEICCALSHYKLWKKLSEDSKSRNYLILEDDTVFKDGFDEFWNVAYHKKFDENAWISYLGGCQPWNKIKYNEVLEKHNDLFLRVKKNDYFIQNDHFWHMNANSYIISKEAAVFLCKYCEQVGMDKAVDVFMISLVNKIDYKKILHINPLMAHQLHEENNNPEPDKNSDLRHALDTFQDSRQKLVFTENNLFEQDFLIELFNDPEIVYDTEMNEQYENACIVYSDIYASNLNLYPEKYRSQIESKKEKREKYFKKLKDKNCCLIHLSDEHCHAEISHYKYFKHVFRQYYRVDVESKNVTFIPLGYKKGFKNE